jgi:hypothetical protein
MTRIGSNLPVTVILASLLSLTTSCGPEEAGLLDAVGTPTLREALFDSILARTARREAFSVPKNEALSFDPLEEMETLRETVVAAGSADELFRALLRLSNARRDRHLSLALVPGGLRPEFADGLEVWSGPSPSAPRQAPIRILPDYGDGESDYFLADIAPDAGVPHTLSPGDRLLTVNGLSMEEAERALSPYIRHSTVAGFRWKLAEALSQRTALLPPSFREESLRVEVAKPDGTRITESISYLSAESLKWPETSEPTYPGFRLRWTTPTYDLFLPEGGGAVLILRWHRFEPSLMEDVDRLITFAEAEGFLDHAVIIDVTRSGGGSLGAYAVQRLQPLPFKTTFGNLRFSDVIEPFVQERREAFQARRVYDGEGPETVDDGTWLLDWLETEVLDGLARGDSLTDPVPFKLAHAPKQSDGILQPAPVHFRGPLVVFSGPNGGSHLDQFMSIVVDNGLGHVIGMPPGGYSNTWEWEETLSYPGTEQHVIGFMWSIGHTIRPNGEVLEGNPAPVHDRLPLTVENHSSYSELLLERAYRHLDTLGYSVAGFPDVSSGVAGAQQ